MVQEGNGQRSSDEDDLGLQIRNLVIVVNEIVMDRGAIYGIVLNAYVVLRG